MSTVAIIRSATSSLWSSQERPPESFGAAWIYLTGWATRDGAIHFRDDVYHHDNRPSRAMVADLRPGISTAARASGFVLQSADPEPIKVEQFSYLDSQ